MAHKVIVYTAPWCPWCTRAKEYLTQKGIKFEERDIEVKPEFREELAEKSGQTGIPVIEIDGELIIGFDEDALNKVFRP